MSGEIIKQFLVGLGFGVDDASLSKFNKAISSATIKVAALYTSIQATAAGIFFGISKISEGFEEIGYQYRIISPAINKALVLRREMLRAYAAAGVNITQAVVGAVKFNMALTKVQYTLKAIVSSVAVKFFPLLTKQMDQFRKQLYANMPKIRAGIENFIRFVFRAFQATVQLGTRLWSILTRVYDFFVKLDQATNGWSTILLGVIAAWKLLNLEFLATPLGLILTGLVAILALFDDFKTWQEGGESLFDWSGFVPVINAVTVALEGMRDIFNSILDAVGYLVVAFIKLFNGNWAGAWDSLKSSLQSVLDLFQNIFSEGKNLGGVLSAISGWAGGLFGGAPQAPNIGTYTGPGSMPPLGVGGNNVNTANTNQHVSQQTSITVMGTADANGTAQAVTSQQQNVNRDLVRNLKGATTPAALTPNQ